MSEVEGLPRQGTWATSDVPGRIAAVAPVPTGFQAAGTFERQEGGRRGVTVVGRIPADDPATIVDRLQKVMRDEGWEERSRSTIDDDLVSLSLRRGDATFNVSVIAHGDRAMLTLMLLESE